MIKINLIHTQNLQTKEYEKELNLNKNIDGIINKSDIRMEDIQNALVPIASECDIFISYSHNDVSCAKSVASYLNYNGYKTFIDCCFWNNVDKALKNYNDAHSKKSNGYYDYDKVIHASASFHMVLCDSIIETIKKCKVFIRIDTKNSLNDKRTNSPWIFLENRFANSMPNTPKKKSMLLHMSTVKFESLSFPMESKGFETANSLEELISIIRSYEW